MAEEPNKLLINLSTQRKAKELAERETEGFSVWGTQAGFYDANRLFSPSQLVGRANSTRGLYQEMRYSHDIISSVLDARVSAISSLDYKIKPKSEDPSIDQIMAAEAVQAMFSNMQSFDLNSFIANVYNSVITYGFALYEIWVPQEGRYAGFPQLLPIAPYQIDRWELNETRDRLDAAWVITDSNIVRVPAQKLVWFGRMEFAGNFWGMSDLRKIVALFSAYKEDLINYLQLRKMQAGIFYFDEKEDGTTQDDWGIASQYLSQYYSGLQSPLIASKGLKPAFLNAQQPGIDNYSNMLGYFDTKIKQSLDSSLSTLGMTGVGSLALGKEFAIEDAIKLENHIYSFLSVINGDLAPESQILQVLTAIAGFSAYDAPCITLYESIADRDNRDAATIIDLIKSGIVTKDELGAEEMAKLLEDLGVDPTHYRKLNEEN